MNKKITSIILIVVMMVGVVAILAGCSDKGVTVEFYQGDEIIDSYKLDDVFINEFPMVKPKDGKVFFSWCNDYDCLDEFDSVAQSKGPLRNGAKIKLYAKMVDPMYVELSGTNINSDYNDKYSIKLSDKARVILEDVIFVGEGVDYTIYTDEALTLEYNNYAYTVVEGAYNVVYVKIQYKDMTRTIALTLERRKVTINFYFYAHTINSDGHNIYENLSISGAGKELYTNEVVNLDEYIRAMVKELNVVVAGYTYEDMHNSILPLDKIVMIDISNFNYSYAQHLSIHVILEEA